MPTRPGDQRVSSDQSKTDEFNELLLPARTLLPQASVFALFLGVGGDRSAALVGGNRFIQVLIIA